MYIKQVIQLIAASCDLNKRFIYLSIYNPKILQFSV